MLEVNELIDASNLYVAPLWCWNEVSRYGLEACSIVHYFYDASCRFPVTKVRAELTASERAGLEKVGTLQGQFYRVTSCFSELLISYDYCSHHCNLQKDGESSIPQDAKADLYLQESVFFCNLLVSKMLRMIDIVDECKVKLTRLMGDTESYDSQEDSWFNVAQTCSHSPSVLLLRALRNSIEHGMGSISLVNYDSWTQTFGLAINLESGVLSDKRALASFNKELVNDGKSTMLQWLNDFCAERRDCGMTPLLSFSCFFLETMLYVIAKAANLAFLYSSLVLPLVTDCFRSIDMEDIDRSIGLYVDLSKLSASGSWNISNRIYPLDNPRRMAEMLKGFEGNLDSLLTKVLPTR